MSQTSLHDGTWRSVILRLSAVCDLEATALTFKAFERRGKVANATSLLRLILMYSVGRLSLRATAAAACGTVIKPPGAGGQWRVHARYDPGRGGFADLRLTPAGTAEATALTRLDAGQTVITDRGYARVRNIEAVLAAGSHVLTRIGWRWLALLTSLPAAAAPPARVVEMYRARWQVELSFKRLKTLGRIDRLPSADSRLARTWLLAHLIVAVLNDELASQIVDSPRSAKPDTSTDNLALASLADGTPYPASRRHAAPAST